MGAVSKIEGVLARDGEHSMEAFMKAERPTTQSLEFVNTFANYACGFSFVAFKTATSAVEDASRTSRTKAV